MGAAVGGIAIGVGHAVAWASASRSSASIERAQRARLRDAGDLASLAAESEMILSICPPHAAAAVAADVAATGFQGLYVDGNAVSPASTVAVGAIVAAAGASYVDGGIVGGPPWQSANSTCLYLSGERAKEVAGFFAGTPLAAIVIDDQVGSASALKMAYAARTKGVAALLAGVIGMAERAGVREHLEQRWGEELTAQIHGQLGGVALKAWRFAGELREIADTMESVGMPGGFHLAGAEVYERLAGFKDYDSPPQVEEILQSL